MIHNIITVYYYIAMIGFPIMYYIIIITFTRETLRIYYITISTRSRYLLFILYNNNNDSNINILNIYRMIYLALVISKMEKR